MGKVDDPFENYFEFLNTTANTRNKNILLRLLKSKLEYGRNPKKYLVAKIFNDLSIEVRKHCKEKNSNSILKNHFLSKIYFDIAYSTLCSCVYPSVYVSMLPSVLQSLTLIGHGLAGASCRSNVLLILLRVFLVEYS